MNSRRFPHLLALITLLMAAAVLAQQPAPPSGTITPQECLAIPPVGRAGRTALHIDPIESRMVAGTWEAPHAGDHITLASGAERTWERMEIGKDGAFRGNALQGGYADIQIDSPSRQIMYLEAVGHSMVYVNGVPRTGDPYSTGWTRLPVALQSGRNELLFLAGRGELKVRLVPATAPFGLDARDMTLPDLPEGKRGSALGAIIVTNATDKPSVGLKLEVTVDSGHRAEITLPTLPPLSTRKVGFPIRYGATAAPGPAKCVAELRETSGHTIDTAKFELRVRTPGQSYRTTFISKIDGSVQYYAVQPAHPAAGDKRRPALFLSLHGAGVEAMGQADAYEAKSWGSIVAPTNRRPYGFDWEDWGCLDAMEVLELAKKTLDTDPRRTYLTGHSMGGHGTWHVGVTFPGRFAAIGPSAGWISFFSYAGAPRPQNPTPLQQMLLRAMATSDTLALDTNYVQDGVYILHGGADDNVPVEQARTMYTTLTGLHADVQYHEQPGAGHWWDASDEPGADCVDWAPMYDFFARRELPTDAEVREVDFKTADPGLSARCHWVTIEWQEKRLQTSGVSIRLDPGKRRFVGTTDNVSRLAVRLDGLPAGDAISVELDGGALKDVPYPKDGVLHLARVHGTWQTAEKLSASEQRPERCGPFKAAFKNDMVFVYGTHGTSEENAALLEKARLDQEAFWYRGNGSIDVLPDDAFLAARMPDRNVIVYGNADTNSAWKSLLGAGPISVTRTAVRIGDREITGTDLACLCVRPRPGSDTALVGIVSGTGVAGTRLTDRLPYFSSGIEFPDLFVISADVLKSGDAGVRAAGLFGPDWGVQSGDFLWQGGMK